MAHKKKIFIHPDHIENLDEKYEKLEKDKKPEKETGYRSICYIRNTRKCRQIHLKANFVKEKCKSGAFIIFKVVDKPQIMLQPVPIEFMNRTSVGHIEKRNFAFFHRYGYKAELDRTPEPATIFYNLGLDPMLKGYVFEMVEYVVQDEAFGEIFAYKLVPVKMG